MHNEEKQSPELFIDYKESDILIEKKKLILWAIIGIIFVSGISIPVIYWIIQQQQTKTPSFTNIAPAIASEMINNNTTYPNLFVLDVRSQSEYNEGHIDDAILIPLNDLETRIGELIEYKDIEIIVYCQSGFRSSQASQILVDHGFLKVYNMVGGYSVWITCEVCIAS
jgi:rhodanese-related sulfurtransferase